jgi:class 3 adenylate cyclase
MYRSLAYYFFLLTALLSLNLNLIGQVSASKLPAENKLLDLIDSADAMLDDGKTAAGQALIEEVSQKAKALSSKKALAEVLYLKAKLALATGRKDQAAKYYLRSLEFFQATADTIGLISCNIQLGVVSFSVKSYQQAIDFLDQAIVFFPTNKTRISTCHYLKALCFSELGEYAQAEQMFDLAESESMVYGGINLISINSYRAKMYLNQEKPEVALSILKQLLETAKKTSAAEADLIQPITFLSTAYLQVKDYTNSVFYSKKVLNFSQKSDYWSLYRQEALSSLHQAYAGQKKFDSAYYFLNRLKTITDSAVGNEVVQKVSQLNQQFEFKKISLKRDAEQAVADALAKQELADEKLLRNVFLGSFMVLLVFALLLFRQRNLINEAKKRSDALLLNILPAQVAEELKEYGSSKPQDFKEVAVLFTDFKQFTRYSATVKASELIKTINYFFTEFDKICETFKIEKIKTIGDAYMAAGGLPTPNKDAVKNTVLAALAMQRIMLKIISTDNYLVPIEMRVGIHTGPVAAGIVGVKKFQYDIWGDTVNTASRIESSGEAGQVNISQTTYDIIKNDPTFTFINRGKIEAKGKGSISMWFVNTKETETTY